LNNANKLAQVIADAAGNDAAAAKEFSQSTVLFHTVFENRNPKAAKGCAIR